MLADPGEQHHLSNKQGVIKRCQDTYATLRICADECSNSDITDTLRLQPTRTRDKGPIVEKVSGRTRLQKFNLWSYCSENDVKSLDLRDHIAWWLETLDERRKALFWLQQKPDITMVMWCTWWPSGRHGGPVLWPRQLLGLSELNLECYFDLYFMS